MTTDLPALVPVRELVRTALRLASVQVVEGSRRNADLALNDLRGAKENGDTSPEQLAAMGLFEYGARRTA